MKPVNYNEIIKLKSPWEQVVRQAYSLQTQIASEVMKIPQHQVLELDYNEVCRSPDYVLKKTFKLCNMLGAQLDTSKITKSNLNCTDAFTLCPAEHMMLMTAHQNFLKAITNE